ncbi:FAD binding domain-containing protein [Hirsutella rhossiliensis]|uniref:FAD binding domain-containing protein n=1 Tax=Hirsutella rhossiliensis TaxID=111463 RepID=A0A9P8SMY5_9HYPO|nr:FAD binding domain-containing protein [Hirsutella rhossiliensis]KAH0966621.1 FAD binding domain-containing protein [Hirsutella rhossiliensis]
MVALQNLFFVSLAALLPASHGLATQSHGRRCRCRPQEPCWPSHHEWQALNSSIDGTLVSVRPAAYACHGPAFDAVACNASSALSSNSVWRASQPGAVQWTNWEAWPERNENCFFDSPTSSPCRQGRVSLFSAMVERAEHIQAANSGHCFMGRSTAPESLQISTTKLKSLSFTDRFLPAGAPQGQPDQGSAVTIGAGVDLKELYTAAARRNLTVVAGMAHTVGAAGGYIQGGGHSPLGNWKGMGSDNALEFTVVNAKGDVVIANNHQNQDLFWALRGGGGGTFGVVVSVSVRTFPSVAAVFVEFGFALPKGSTSAYWELIEKLHARLPVISDAGGCGYYFVMPKTQPQNGTEVLTLSGGFVFLNDTRTDKARKAMNPLAADLRRHALPGSVYNVGVVPQFSEWINTALKGDADTTGGILLLGSRMVSRDFLARPDGPGRLRDALKDVHESMGGVGFTGHVVAGGAVARSTVDSALNPAWRRTLTHIAFGADWNSSTPAAEQKGIQDKMTNVAVERLRALEPDMGAYLNEADAYEKGFQRSFWGVNYERLYAIKKAQDPMGLFIARKGVGSEDWDDAGLCRVW